MALLTAVVGGDAAADAADGWTGDWYVAWKDGSASCLRATFVMDFMSTSEGLDLTRAFTRIKNPKVRRKVVELVRTLAEDPSH